MNIHHYFHNDPDARVTRLLADILTQLTVLTTQGEQIMATLQELRDELTDIKTKVDEAKVTSQQQIDLIAELKAQIAAGSPVTQADLDSLDAQADSILAALSPPAGGGM